MLGWVNEVNAAITEIARDCLRRQRQQFQELDFSRRPHPTNSILIQTIIPHFLTLPSQKLSPKVRKAWSVSQTKWKHKAFKAVPQECKSKRRGVFKTTTGEKKSIKTEVGCASNMEEQEAVRGPTHPLVRNRALAFLQFSPILNKSSSLWWLWWWWWVMMMMGLMVVGIMAPETWKLPALLLQQIHEDAFTWSDDDDDDYWNNMKMSRFWYSSLFSKKFLKIMRWGLQYLREISFWWNNPPCNPISIGKQLE